MEEQDLLLMVGEIRSDVKKLLKADEENDRRISRLERYSWMIAGAAGALGALAPSAVAKALGF